MTTTPITLDLDLAPPGEMSMPTITGGAIEIGSTLAGSADAVDMTGGGLVTVSYDKIMLTNESPAPLLYWSRLGLMLNPRVRKIVVPLYTAWAGRESWLGSFGANAAVNAGTVTIIVSNPLITEAPIEGGEWFSVEHSNPRKWHRAYGIVGVDSVTDLGAAGIQYVCQIAPTLREAVSISQPIDFRPKCLMRLAPDSKIEAKILAGDYALTQVSFLEA